MAAVTVQGALNDPRPADDPRIELIAQLRAKSYYLPDLKQQFKECPNAVNPYYPQLKVSLDARINKLYSPERAADLLKGDYGLCTSLWWPRATPKRLETCTFWLLWLFTWDDEIDRSISDLFLSLPDADRFRDETYHFVRYCLGVPTEETDKWMFESNPPTRVLIRSFDVVAEGLKQVYNQDQVMAFVDAMGHYMQCQQREQHCKLIGELPTPEKYWETRLGTSAVLVMLALNEYANGQSIPRWIMDHEQMTAIWRECNFNVSILNDVLSLRKEIQHGDIYSIVPILMHHHGLTVQAAIADAYTESQKSLHRFDVATKTLLKVVKEKEAKQWDEVDKFITGCRYNLTGHCVWSVVSGRYSLGNMPRDEHGGITIDTAAA
ncbi:isoprenoid synthase domain-containing protein [Xylaria flabelliformis]|nr:isoprenoid synthase domain-containing protein [Xylaria flabelliformis]